MPTDQKTAPIQVREELKQMQWQKEGFKKLLGGRHTIYYLNAVAHYCYIQNMTFSSIFSMVLVPNIWRNDHYQLASDVGKRQ